MKLMKTGAYRRWVESDKNVDSTVLNFELRYYYTSKCQVNFVYENNK